MHGDGSCLVLCRRYIIRRVIHRGVICYLRNGAKQVSQKTEILDWLKREPITAIQALAHIRCMRLAARSDELRHEGYAIHTEMITVGSGKQVARYVLVA